MRPHNSVDAFIRLSQFWAVLPVPLTVWYHGLSEAEMFLDLVAIAPRVIPQMEKMSCMSVLPGRTISSVIHAFPLISSKTRMGLHLRDLLTDIDQTVFWKGTAGSQSTSSEDELRSAFDLASAFQKE